MTKLVNLFFLTLLFCNCSGTRILSTTDYVVDKNEIYEDGILLKNDPINFVLKTKSNSINKSNHANNKFRSIKNNRNYNNNNGNKVKNNNNNK